MADKLSITKKKNSTYHEMRRGLTIIVVFSPIILFAFYIIGLYLWTRITQRGIFFANNDPMIAFMGLIMVFALVLFLRRLRHIVTWRRGLFAELRRIVHIREDYLAAAGENVSDEEAVDALDYGIDTTQEQSQRQ